MLLSWAAEVSGAEYLCGHQGYELEQRGILRVGMVGQGEGGRERVGC